MYWNAFLLVWATLLSSAPGVLAQTSSLATEIARPRQSTVRFCELPQRRRTPPAVLPSTALTAATEIEPNGTVAQATFLDGFGLGPGEDGSFDVTGALARRSDVDVFGFDLDAGDVLGAELAGAGTALTLRGPAENTLVRSAQDASFIYPDASPLPGDGVNSSEVLAWVAATAGRFTIAVSGGRGNYTLRLRLFRPPLDSAPSNERQIIFLDFDGATVNASALFGSGNTNATLSPLSSFLAGWGLGAASQNAVIDAIVAGVNDGLSDLFGANNPAFDFEVRNSRDHGEQFGQPNVSRVILGGTIQELGISTIGIAESIDPGNFDTTETAVVLLDLLSAPDGNANSINSIDGVTPGNIVQAIGKVVGNVAVHELGHYSANFHTENSIASSVNDVRSIMDAGGVSLARNIGGVGPDNTFGTADDQEVDLSVDEFEADEGFLGDEDTTNLTAFGLTTSNGPTPTPTPTGSTPTPTKTPTPTPTTVVPLCFGRTATIVGTSGNDTLSGGAGTQVIVGLGGDDTLNGGGGDDFLCGNEGNDQLDGGFGTDACDGGSGANTLQRCEN